MHISDGKTNSRYCHRDWREVEVVKQISSPCFNNAASVSEGKEKRIKAISEEQDKFPAQNADNGESMRNVPNLILLSQPPGNILTFVYC